MSSSGLNTNAKEYVPEFQESTKKCILGKKNDSKEIEINISNYETKWLEVNEWIIEDNDICNCGYKWGDCWACNY
jgi:hypothetical protein